MNVVLVQIDSLNRHFLRCYGNDWVDAPNLAAFAEGATVFDNHYAGSLPCMPARREIWAGTEEFWWRPWGPLEPWDEPIAYLAGRRGVTTALVTDHYHFFEWGGHGYVYDFDGYEFVRGHELDNWRTAPVAEVPDWARVMVERWEGAPEPLRYVRNVAGFAREEDFFAPRVMTAAAAWLRENASRQPFYLHVDCFDVHEPFHVPEPYRSLYTDSDHRRFNPWPRYGRADEIDPEELDWVRAQFAGKLAMVDRWLGLVLDALDETGLWERTAVVLTTDHGHFLGEHGWIGKPAAPLYDTLCRIPLLVRHPDGRAGRVSAITQTVDLHATVLELLGVDVPERANVHSRSFARLLRDPGGEHRPFAVYGYNNERIGVATDRWTLLREHDVAAARGPTYGYGVDPGGGPGFSRRRREARPRRVELVAGDFVPGAGMPVWRMTHPRDPAAEIAPPRPDLLFENGRQDRDLARERPDVVAELAGLVADHARSLGAPAEQLVRLRLD